MSWFEKRTDLTEPIEIQFQMSLIEEMKVFLLLREYNVENHSTCGQMIN